VLAIENVAGKVDSSWSNPVCSSFNYQSKAVNAFSPNGDGINDFFYIKDIDKIRGNQVYVFNRWGNVVFSAKNYDNSLVKWDGGGLPEGTYFFIITVDGETVEKGTILLQR
jgi:gliding motility-associated-like protein